MFKFGITGVRATGKLHIGNLISIFENLQEYTGSMLIMIADLHAMIDGELKDINLLKRTLLGIIKYHNLSNRIIPFIQSENNHHLETMWILANLVNENQLNTIVTIKDNKNISLSKKCYPVLMAADILLYRADFVPVGEDQRQHIEFYNRLKKKIENLLNDKFPDLIVTKRRRIMDLRNSKIKMSKSNNSEKGIIYISENSIKIREKFAKALSSSENISSLNPAIENLYNISDSIWPQGSRLIRKIKGKKHFILKSVIGLGVGLELSKLQKSVQSITDLEISRYFWIGNSRSKYKSSQVKTCLNKIFQSY